MLPSFDIYERGLALARVLREIPQEELPLFIHRWILIEVLNVAVAVRMERLLARLENGTATEEEELEMLSVSIALDREEEERIAREERRTAIDAELRASFR